MSFDWKEYICLAEDLLSQAKESYSRSSISRAYYGVFCITRNKKDRKNYAGPNVHQRVIHEYKNSSNRNEKDVGRILDELRRLRNIADYNEDKTIEKDHAEKAAALSKQILKKLGIP